MGAQASHDPHDGLAAHEIRSDRPPVSAKPHRVPETYHPPVYHFLNMFQV
jgi:hypothetical protein